ncbi:uncharacterized protein TrAFT101_000161 [Trichoderma asperellum]|uniref:uncharacterized protein n=1 Tax=Trichoderma asperellum TaxID=101201 RepID=UPI00332BD73F|nr:hypothetical protein TrAFT101_000161 [Trichoderma asperellum]
MSTLPVSLLPASRPQPQISQRKLIKKGGYTRQRRGCLTCRQRKKKCDQGLPICGHCSRLNLVCKHEKPREVVSSTCGEDAARDSAGSEVRQRWGYDNSNSPHGDNVSEVVRVSKIFEPLDFVRSKDSVDHLSSSRRTMMRYYTSTLAIMLSATAENNCFLSVLLPMAFDCATLLDAMAAWSSAHLALRDPSFNNVSLQHRGRVLSNLSAALNGNNLSGEMCLAITMAMCSMETISDATTSGWAHHLFGAAAVLQSGISDVQEGALQKSRSIINGYWLESVERKWLVRNFAYHDILMSVSLDRRPLITGDYWMSADDEMADPYFAFASKIMLLTSEISVLNADCADYELSLGDGGSPEEDAYADIFGGLPSSSNYDTFLQRARDIAAELREWKCPTASADTPLGFLSQTYQSAGLIYLHYVLQKYFPQHSDDILTEGVDVYVELVCDAAQKVPEGSLAECSLLFPLFIAGGEAKNETHIERIKNRLYTMNKWRRFRNVNACREVLEELWEQRAQLGETETIGWRDIVRQRGWQLALS